jgi:hypothetical protein
MLIKLFRLYLRESWNGHNLSFLVLMLLVSGLLFSNQLPIQPSQGQLFRPVSLSIVDDDKSLISYTLADQFADLSVVDQIYVESLESARQRLSQNDILLILVIPQGFYEATVQGGERPSLTVYLNEHMPTESGLFVRMLNNMAASITALQSAIFTYHDLALPLYSDPSQYNDISIQAGTNLVFKLVGRQSILAVDDRSKLGTVQFVVSSLLCVLAMLTGLLPLLGVQRERRHGLHERLVLAGIRWWQSILAKQTIGLLWLIAGFAPILAGLERFYPTMQFWPAVAAILLLYWITSLLAQGLAYLEPPGDIVILLAWMGLFLFLVLGGCIYPWELLPAWLQNIGLLSPARWSQQFIYQSMVKGAASIKAIYVLAAMVLAATLFSAAAWHRAQPVTSTS